MANWLDKALGRKSSTTSIAIVPFDVRCECGSRLTGLRADRARRAICAQCGEAHFILPVNKYPESERTYFSQATTTAPPDAADDGPGQRDEASQQGAPVADVYAIEPGADAFLQEDFEPDIEFDAEDPDDGASPNPMEAEASDDLLDFLNHPPGAQTQRPRQRRDSLYEAIEPEDPSPQKKSAEQSEAAYRRPARKTADRSRPARVPSGMIEVRQSNTGWGQTRKRVLLVVGGIALLATVMAFWTIHSRSVDQAEARLATAKDAGLDAFERGNFAEAREQLRIAVDALEIVGTDEEQIAPIRRKWLEAEVATHLLDGTLVDLVEATRAARSFDHDDWRKQFDVSFAGRWLLLDLSPVERIQCSIKDKDGNVKSTETRLAYPWSVDDKPVQIAGVETLLTDRSRIVLAGRLTDSEFDDDAQAWVVRFDPDDSFLWTEFNALVELGFASGDDAGLSELLQEQQSAAGSLVSNESTELAERPADPGAEEGE